MTEPGALPPVYGEEVIMVYFVGIDIGGTFTDAWAIRDDGSVRMAKTSSTPPDFERGFLQALTELASAFDVSVETFLKDTVYLGHGTTVATNIMVQRTGARVGLLVTRGHRDALRMMRATGRVAGLGPEQLADTKNTNKPAPIVDPQFIREINERVDVDGDIVVALAENDVRRAVETLKRNGIQAVGVSFLWSFVNPIHETFVKDYIRDLWPDVFTSVSHELSPQIGEYERAAAVAINCYVGPETQQYLQKLEAELRRLGYSRPLYITQCAGGVMSAEEAMTAPIKTFQSGPVSGINAASRLGGPGSYIITTDMGGTSFDVGLIVAGQPLSRKSTVVDQYEYLLPTIDIQSIGSGGGSIAWFDSRQGALRVGPRSAGAQPGPACYGRGGQAPTVTDADLYLGYLNADYFLGGTMTLNRQAAEEAIELLAHQAGLSTLETAAGIKEIVDKQMGDLIRRLTLGKGYDPRDFRLFAYGGAGPVHAASFAKDVGVQEVVVPGSSTSSVWSAFGAATSDLVHVVEMGCYFKSPFDPAAFTSLIQDLTDQLDGALGSGTYEVMWTGDMHYANQISELEIELPPTSLSSFSEEVVRRFQAAYERTYGQGSGFHGVEVEVVAVRGRARKSLGQPDVVWSHDHSPVEPIGSRSVYWPEYGMFRETPIYRRVSGRLSGPLIVELPVTSVVVHPRQTIECDDIGNLIIRL
ncbi:MAG: hydantoinase/oxoprolinase family protein [Firmicutes bacterium]|nr:hydantoinase/oxoprolinase family protein [Bacillota bacterium]